MIDAVPTADAAGLYIAQDDGFFAQQGLTVKIAPINGGEYGMGDLQTGKAQLVEGNYVSFILAQVAGKFAAPDPTNPDRDASADQAHRHADHRRLVADAAGQPGALRDADRRYKTVAELAKAHATVGVNSLHNIGSVLLGSLLAADGYRVELGHADAGDPPGDAALLAKHKIPAAWLPEPFGTEAEQQYGAVQLADFDQGSLQNFPIGTIVGSAQWVKSHPNTVAAFLRAYDEGQQIADTNRSAVEKALVKHTGRVEAGRRDHDARHVPAGHGRPRHAAGVRRDVRVRRHRQALQHHQHDPAGAAARSERILAAADSRPGY